MSVPMPKRPLLSIEEQWKSLAAAIFKVEPRTIQYLEMRKAFFAGFTCAFMGTVEATGHYTEEQLVAHMRRLTEEISKFEQSLGAEVKGLN